MGNIPDIVSAYAAAIPPALPPFFRDHHVGGRPVLPAVEAMEWLVTHAELPFQADAPLTLRDIRFDKFLFLDGPEPPLAVARMSTGDDGIQSGTLTSRFRSPGAAITRTLMHAALAVGPGTSAVARPALDAAACLTGIVTRVDADRIYRDMVPFGPAYRNIRRLMLSPDGALARVGSPDPPDARTGLRLGSPYVLDAAFHAACVWCQRYCDTVAFPVAIARRDLIRPTRLDEPYTARIMPVRTDGPPFVFDIFIYDAQGGLREAAHHVEMRDVSGGRRTPPVDFRQPAGENPLAAFDRHVAGRVLVEREAVDEFAGLALSDRERQRLMPMTPSRGKGYLSARLALKRLSRRLSGNADRRRAHEIETVAADGQRPQCPLADGTRPHCSVAHDRRFTIAVAANRPVGVDVEPLSDKPLHAPDLYMDAAERALVNGSPLDPAAAALRVWCIKEAAAKAMGRDLAEMWQRARVTMIAGGESRLKIDGSVDRVAGHATAEGHLFTLLTLPEPS